MTILLTLIPISLLLGLIGLLAFVWSVGDSQYDDPDGAANRILDAEFDDRPATECGCPGSEKH
jgi:cbb3-type cytochrome oxidase maturation protein